MRRGGGSDDPSDSAVEFAMIWTDEMVEQIKALYPKLGVKACAESMGISVPSVRMKASRLQLKARGESKAWHKNCKKHGELLKGRKRQDQSEVMRRNHREGKLKKTPEQLREAGARINRWISENGHPRGALGMKHSEETKRIIGEKSKLAQANYTAEKKIEIVRRALKTRDARGCYAMPSPFKTWKAGWREIGGIKKYYRSAWEANYARYLEWLRSKNQIRLWAHEPKTFWFDGVKRGCVSYLPDFRVVDANGEESYHEVKGWMDARSRTKIRRMKKYFPDIRLVVIDAKQYRRIATHLKGLISEWEG